MGLFSKLFGGRNQEKSFDAYLENAISSQQNRRDILFERQRPNDADYGYSMENPICTSSVNAHESYLSCLRDPAGKPVSWERSYSSCLKECHGIPNVTVDRYIVTLSDGSNREMFFCAYGHNSSYVPDGFTLAPPPLSPQSADLVRRFTHLSIVSLAKKYYSSILELSNQSTLTNNAKFEIIPLLFVIADLATVEANRDRAQTVEALRSALTANFSSSDFEKLDCRIDLYASIVRGETHVRAEWFMGSDMTAINAHPVAQCSSALCDILINPSCADNYDSAPILLRGFTENMAFAEEVAIPIGSKLFEMYKKLLEEYQRFPKA